MANGIIKLALVVAISIHAVLWSHSRQAAVDLHSARHRPSLRLLARQWATSDDPIYHTTSNVTVSDVFFNSHDTCQPTSVPIDHQCDHVKRTCSGSPTITRIPYLQYFCKPPNTRPAYFFALVMWLLFLFSTIGIGASDFFCPNLATISTILGLDENVAGVTFLAFGNGSPDVFSTFSAMKANSGSLAIGELLGAATFIISVVVGSMCLVKPFKVEKGPFLRDVGFFMCAVSVLLAILWDGKIRAWEAGMLVTLYTFYVLVVVTGSWWERRTEKRRVKERLLRAEYAPDEPGAETPTSLLRPYLDEPIEAYFDEPEDPAPQAAARALANRIRSYSTPESPSIRMNVPNETSDRMRLSLHIPEETPDRRARRASSVHPRPPSTQLPSFSLIGALEFRSVVTALRRESNTSALDIFQQSPITPFAAGHYPRRSGTPATRQDSQGSLELPHVHDPRGHSSEQNPWESTLGHLQGGSLSPEDTRSSRRPSVLQVPPPAAGKSPVPSIQITDDEDVDVRSPGTEASHVSFAEDTLPKPRSKRERVWSALTRTMRVLFPTLVYFTDKSFLGMVVALFAAPAVLALTVTLPVVFTPVGDANVHKKGTDATSRPLDGRTAEEQLIDFEDEEGAEWTLVAEEIVGEEMHGLTLNKWLMAAQLVLGPLFCATVLLGDMQHFPLYATVIGIAGAVAAVLVLIFADDGSDPAGCVARCSMGFFVAIVWIMAIADEVVQVLQTFGLIFGISDAIIGLTVFAIGNSLADFVANITVAAFAPIMGFSACFGGPMLNMLLGVGLSGTYVIHQTGVDYPLSFNKTLLVTGFCLLSLLVVTIVFVPLNGYMLTRRWGIFLIICYLITMGTTVAVELKGQHK